MRRVFIFTACLATGSLAACMPPRHGGEHAGEADHAKYGASARPLAPDPQLEMAARGVRVMARNDLGCRPEVLGLVDVHEDVATTEQALQELKMRAAQLGAEAVIGVDFSHGDGHEATHLSGMAVRCRDLIRGRAYDMIGKIEVPGEMGGEHEALRRLKDRGRELRADLLIDVVFDHGEAGRGPTKLRVTAIRFRPDAQSAALATP